MTSLLRPLLAAGLVLLTLSGCVAYPAGYGYGYGGDGGYYAPSATVVVPIAPYGGYHHGWGGGWGRGGRWR